ncbi:MAG: hypothetical protein EOM44_00525 [Bacteroidia bacterium]|nr:hypothetical protein [Bacteroidia bacterium]
MTYKKNELVIVNNSSDNMLIDARLLHQQLQIATRFDTWIQRRIEEFGFEKNQDYFELRSNLSIIIPGRKPTDYHLTMDMAKELAMLERNEVGKRIRQYFIAVEKQARAERKPISGLPTDIESISINGRAMYPFKRMALALGYTSGGGIYERKRRYPNHFIEFDKITYVSEELATLMMYQRQQLNYRAMVKDMEPVLPLDWGTQPLELKGGHAL